VKIRLEKRGAELRHVAPVCKQGDAAKHFGRRPGPRQQRKYRCPDEPAANAASERIRRNRYRGNFANSGARERRSSCRSRTIQSRLIGDLQRRTCRRRLVANARAAPGVNPARAWPRSCQCVVAVLAANSAIIFFSSSCRPALSASRNAAACLWNSSDSAFFCISSSLAMSARMAAI